MSALPGNVSTKSISYDYDAALNRYLEEEEEQHTTSLQPAQYFVYCATAYKTEIRALYAMAEAKAYNRGVLLQFSVRAIPFKAMGRFLRSRRVPTKVEHLRNLEPFSISARTLDRDADKVEAVSAYIHISQAGVPYSISWGRLYTEIGRLCRSAFRNMDPQTSHLALKYQEVEYNLTPHLLGQETVQITSRPITPDDTEEYEA